MITLEPFDLDRHLPVVRPWFAHPRSVYWQLTEASDAEVRAEYQAIDVNPHHHAHLGRVEGEASFLAETYDPSFGELAGLPELRPGDLGMHVLVAPPEQPRGPRPGFTREVFRAVLEFCFADPGVRRVVVEPDVRNRKIGALNAAAGFEVVRELPLAGKTAALSFCTRERFLGSPLIEGVDR